MKRAVTKAPNHQSIQRIPQSASGQIHRGWSGTAHVSPGPDGEAIVRSNWVLEIYRGGMRQNSLIAMHEFDDFPSLRAKIVENRACRFLIDPPDHATSHEFQCLLDLRGQGFKVQRK
jgi:hypothetical protein